MGRAKIPDWIKKIKKNSRSRERYFLKKYGNLSRMRAIDDAVTCVFKNGFTDSENQTSFIISELQKLKK